MPGGLGSSEKYDVNRKPKAKIFKAMEFAKKRDLVAKQYSNGFKDVFDIGIPAYKIFYKKWGKVNWALTGVYLTFLQKYHDTHIIRKNGIKIAINVKKKAGNYYKFVKNSKNLDKIKRKLLIFDKKLKKDGINPGTSADLTVATFFIELVTKKQ